MTASAKTYFHYFILIVFAVVWGACAAIQPPPGGPEDKTPPTIVELSPADRSINVSRTPTLHFLFEQPLDRASLVQSFSITPYLEGAPTFDWSGYDEVTITLPGALRENTTYTVSLGRDLRTRRGIQLSEPLYLTFSTGPQIDTAVLSGLVLPAFESRDVLKTTNIFVFAYDLRQHAADTLDLSRTPPDYLSQPDPKGGFTFRALKEDRNYRIFAVQDEFRNRVYDRGTDPFGMPPADAVLDSNVYAGFRIRMAPGVDTSFPFMQDAEVTDSLHLRLRFSESLDSASIRKQYFQAELPGRGSVQVVGAFRENLEKRPGHVTLLLSSPIAPGAELIVRASYDSIRDVAGNAMRDTLREVRVIASDQLASLAQLIMHPTDVQDSSRDLSPLGNIPISFSDAVERESVEAAVSLTDTAGNQLPLRFAWTDDAHVTLRSHDSLRAGQFYTLTLRQSAIRSPSVGVPSPRDTTILIRFQTSDPRDNGLLAGDITVADSLWGPDSSRMLVVHLVGLSQQFFRTEVLRHRATHYVFPSVPRGRYRIRAFLSSRADHTFDPGSAIPWRFADPSGDFPAEVDVRPRWAVEKVDIEVR